ncbi:unnamed protein product [Macrosiphum euphorbiae]|nr:unnamed protein product [Macrosiphum euphorbiae]
MPTLASGLDKLNWSVVKQLLYSEFQNTNIEIHIYHKNDKNISQNWKSKEHPDTISNIHNFLDNSNDKNETKIKVTQPEHNDQAYNIFTTFKPGENVLSDGNCGIYAVCNALNDHKINKITSILEILQLLDLNELPDYWWSDEDLAAIAHYCDHDTYNLHIQ